MGECWTLDRKVAGAILTWGAVFVSLSKTFHPHCLVLVKSRKRSQKLLTGTICRTVEHRLYEVVKHFIHALAGNSAKDSLLLQCKYHLGMLLPSASQLAIGTCCLGEGVFMRKHE